MIGDAAFEATFLLATCTAVCSTTRVVHLIAIKKVASSNDVI